MTIGEIVIKVESNVTEHIFEKLEDDVRNLLEGQGIGAEIFDSVTGNTTRTRRDMMGKNDNEFADQTIRGELILGEKIWFNDDLRCRLRICGFTKEQIEGIRNAKFVDLTLTDFVDQHMSGVVIDIKGWDLNRKEKKRDDINMTEDEKDVYEQIHENLLKMVPKIKLDESNLKNVIYKEVIQILEPLESRGKYKGNAHHLTQDIVEKVTSAIMEKMDIPER